jgi:hypothetical protein
MTPNPMALPGSAPSSQGDPSVPWSLPAPELSWEGDMFVGPVFSNFYRLSNAFAQVSPLYPRLLV